MVPETDSQANRLGRIRGARTESGEIAECSAPTICRQRHTPGASHPAWPARIRIFRPSEARERPPIHVTPAPKPGIRGKLAEAAVRARNSGFSRMEAL